MILKQVQMHTVVKVPDLTRLLGVSVDTVRRDLKLLEQNGQIKCVRGGACLPDSLAALLNFKGREIIHSDLKQEAAAKAMLMVQPGMTIALNSGTTNTILAQKLAFRGDAVTVITNNLAAIQILIQNPAVHLISIGGMVDSTEQSTYGTVCEQEFGTHFPDLAFLSINAVNEQDGFTDFRYHEMGVIRLLAERARKKVAVMDSSKLGKKSKQKVLGLDQVDLLLMDGEIPKEVKKRYEKYGLTIC
ncbi:MAG: DeoR/GlpR family DNA-binding transcription regulator [Lachnospiraceae bacterium]